LQQHVEHHVAPRERPGRNMHTTSADFLNSDDSSLTSPQINKTHTGKKASIQKSSTTQELLVWQDDLHDPPSPSKRLSPKQDPIDVISWTSPVSNRELGNPRKRPSEQAHKGSGDVISWSSPQSEKEFAPRVIRKAVFSPKGNSGVPWGTEDDIHSKVNPHRPHLTKKCVADEEDE